MCQPISDNNLLAQRKASQGHGLYHPGCLQNILQTNLGNLSVFVQVSAEVFCRRIFDPSPLTQKPGNAFGLELSNVDVFLTAIWPPVFIWRSEVAALEMA